MLRTFRVPLSWGELVRRTARETVADNALGLAAQLAYYFLLALVPAIVCVVALASFLPPESIQNSVNALARFAPGDVITLLREQLIALAERQNEGVLTFGLLLALWSSSAGMVAIVDALNRAYDIEEGRPWWKVRLTAILLTIGVAVFIVIALGLVLVGPTVADGLAARLGFGGAFTFAWKVVQWPIAFALVALGLGIIYYFAPDADQDWEWITPGAVLGTFLWLVASLAFKLYVSRFGSYNETYGSLGALIVLMLWFYLSGLAILIGAEMNAEIEHSSPHGKAPGEKVPGERTKIGAAAARAYEERQRTMSPTPTRGSAGDAGPTEPRRVPVAAYVVLVLAVARSWRHR